jgi:alpha-N-arabinofuranosidase
MNEIIIKTDQPQGIINRNIYGHFAEHLGRCIYEGLWVGPDSPIPNTRGIRHDVVAALKKLNIPVLRWPGGCFADEYHWKDGIGPREKRPSMINTHWGGTVENNHFGTHEFFDLIEQLGTEAYVCGNVGSGTPQEMMEWVEYMTTDAISPMANLRRQNGREKPWKLKYFGVGNESWGCGGNMRPEFYADNYRRYNTFVKNYPGNVVERFACGSSGEDFNWTEVVMSIAGRSMNGLSLHYYTLPTGIWGKKGSATGFPAEEWDSTMWRTLRMDELVTKHSGIMDKHDPEKKVGMVIDEWGTWYDVEPGHNPGWLYQQSSIRDAVLAAVNFHIFHKHHARVTMTNIAQTINVLQAMILTDKEKMILTPTYHVFEMFKVHQDATFIPVEISTRELGDGVKKYPAVDAGASRDRQGRLHLSLVNLHPGQSEQVVVKIKAGKITGRLLTGSKIDSHNTFTSPEEVVPTKFTTFQSKGDRVELELPARSVVVLEMV